MWVSDETMYMCNTFATISNEGKYVLFFVQYCSWWLWYPLVLVLYLMVTAFQPKALVCLKQQMFHDTWLCIILWLCCTCQWVATWHGQTTLTEEDILYLCICLYFELIWKTKQDYWYPFLTHQAFMHTSINTHKALRLDHVDVTPT